ncbi:MAG: RNA polymerase sigma factor [Candidatus Eiseniibacteriota bacterium]
MTTIAWTFALAAPVSDASPTTESRAADDERARIQAARSGDERAFRVLVDRYRDRIFGLALRMAGSREAAEEIAQDAFVRAWQALPGFRGESRFSTWLYRIAFRRALDERVALGRRRGRETAMEPAALEQADTRGARTPDWGTRLRLERAIGELPEAQRACITLFYAGDQSIEEIARVLDAPTGTVKTHLHRARAALRERLEAGHDS